MMGAAADEEAERQLREVQEVFALFDVDGSGSLSADEVGGRPPLPLACEACRPRGRLDSCSSLSGVRQPA